jgi:hypothetical protein
MQPTTLASVRTANASSILISLSGGVMVLNGWHYAQFVTMFEEPLWVRIEQRVRVPRGARMTDEKFYKSAAMVFLELVNSLPDTEVMMMNHLHDVQFRVQTMIVGRAWGYEFVLSRDDVGIQPIQGIADMWSYKIGRAIERERKRLGQPIA